MSRIYKYEEVNILDLTLDDENPRFASSILVQDSITKTTEESIIMHLLKYADIIKLANRINTVEELHGSDLITCYKRGEEYVVLEGNRRTCACKLLLNRSLIPEEYKAEFPVVTENTKENIEKAFINVYPSRESVQAYLSDRHISGVKKWSALEKNNYYMNLFQTYNDFKKVKEYTSDRLGDIKKSIRKYQFFMDVFHVLKARHKDIEIEKLDYLPMVDRFMNTLVGSDQEVGLNLNLNQDNQKYQCENSKLSKYNQILMLVGESFLVRNEKKHLDNNELNKIVATEIKDSKKQVELIKGNTRIPGLLDLIREYKLIGTFKNVTTSPEDEKYQDKPEKDNQTEQNASNDSNANDEGAEEVTKNEEEAKNADGNDSDENKESGKYIPPKTKIEFLCFTEEEAKNFKIYSKSDYDTKIVSILNDLSKFSVHRHPYTCALLYRTLLEICTKMVYDKHSSKINKGYNENNLVGNMQCLNNTYLFANKQGKDIPKIKLAIKSNLSDQDIIQILNLYIHYSNPVDKALLLSTWNSMKFYIQACLEM